MAKKKNGKTEITESIGKDLEAEKGIPDILNEDVPFDDTGKVEDFSQTSTFTPNVNPKVNIKMAEIEARLLEKKRRERLIKQNQPDILEVTEVPAENKRRNSKSKKKQFQDPDLTSFVFGKVQPQAIALEEAVLGATMLDKDAMFDIPFVRAEHFYIDNHQIIFKAIKWQFDNSLPIDLLTITERLRKMGKLEDIGGPYYLVELTNRVASAANIEYHSRIIVQKYSQRRAIIIGTNIIRDSYDDTKDVFDVIGWGQNGLMEIVDTSMKTAQTLASFVKKASEHILEVKKNDGKLTGVPTGYSPLDARWGGFQKGDLIVPAARSSMGKTTHTLNCLWNATKLGKGGLFQSGEMYGIDIAKTIIAMEMDIINTHLYRGDANELEFSYVMDFLKEYYNAPFLIDDTNSPTWAHIRKEATKAKKKSDIQWYGLDFLQTCSLDGLYGGNKVGKIESLTKNLKALAGELNIPVIAICQLKRADGSRAKARPILSDIKECGAIEELADLVYMLYRPEYYGYFYDKARNSLKGVTEVLTRKFRKGATGVDKQYFEKEKSKFWEYDSLTHEAIKFHYLPELNNRKKLEAGDNALNLPPENNNIKITAYPDGSGTMQQGGSVADGLEERPKDDLPF